MRDIPVGNGSLLVNFDEKYQIRDIYFPHVGQENHTVGFPFRFGLWIDGEFSWTYREGWEYSLKYLPDTLVTDVVLSNENLGIELRCNDTVAGRENIFIRRVVATNKRPRQREMRIFLHQDFRIYENKVGDTAFYDPDSLALIHYKKHRYFLINTEPHFDEFATGRKDFLHTEGTWRDAEDGHLYGGAITEGSVDSAIGIFASVEPEATFTFHYWIAAGSSRHEVSALNAHVETRGAETYLLESSGFWSRWVKEPHAAAGELSDAAIDLYKRSLLIIRTQVDKNGAIIAANDHDVAERATDHYSYLWPRDGAFVANALDAAGYHEMSRRFFELCGEIVHDRGYFLQKYNPDGTVGSGWHAHWDKYKKERLVPIQEDETALVLWALRQHHEMYPDPVLVNDSYDKLIVKCADFLTAFRDETTGLPKPSWNLWEDHLGVHTFTCSTVVAGLRAAAAFAHDRGDTEREGKYRLAAQEIVVAMRTHLYDEGRGHFLRALSAGHDGKLYPDATLDASIFGIFYFGCYGVDDTIVTSTMAQIEARLGGLGSVGGVVRFEDDGYMRGEALPPNPWVITTLWLAEYYIAAARTIADLDKARQLIDWTVRHAMPSGVLAEQIDPSTGEPRSVSPLTWSHSTYVATVLAFLKKLEKLRRDEAGLASGGE